MMISKPRASLPAIWGKLPDRGDYIRSHATNREVEDWRTWLDKQPWLYAPVAPAAANHTERRHWMHLTPDFSRDKALALHNIPWGFVLHPNVLPFSGRGWVTGVVSLSHDSIGRSYPLVIYQVVNSAWLERHLTESQGWLYWLAQLVAGHVNPERQSAGDLPARVDRLWALHNPAWGSRLFRRWSGGQAACRALVGEQGKKMASELRGVPALPWANWPHQLWTSPISASQGWFWQQDLEGGFLDARYLRGGAWLE